MPANLTPQYLAAEKKFKEAETVRDKIEALEEMMATIPKHKGTEKLQADLKRRMAKLQAEGEKKHGASKASAMYTVEREGAGQIVLVGAPNVGKSSLLAKLTHATPEIGDYPFTTRLPQPGMMPFENIQIQMVDMPPIATEVYEPWMGSIVRHADFSLLIVDLGSDELLEEVEGVLKILEQSRVRIVGKRIEQSDDDASKAAACYALLVANKADSPSAADNLQILREFYADEFEIVSASSTSGEGLENLRRIIFERLGVIRIYTKVPGKKADLSGAPFVLKNGSTVLDLARAIHREFEHTLKFAKVWSSERPGCPAKYDGQMVERTHRLEDGDILELHA